VFAVFVVNALRQHLMVEVKSPEESFPTWCSTDLSLHIVEYNHLSDEYKPPFLLSIPQDASVRDLREAVAGKLRGWYANIRLVVVSEDGAAMWEELVDTWKERGDSQSEMENAQQRTTLRDYRILKGDTVHVEWCTDYHKGTSRIMEKLDKQTHLVKIKYNQPRKKSSNEEEAEKEMEMEAEIDARERLSTLKAYIGETLSLSVSEFKLRRGEGGREYKDLSKKLMYYGLEDGSCVYVEKGTPLQQGEYVFKVFLAHEEEDGGEIESGGGSGTDAPLGQGGVPTALPVTTPPPVAPPVAPPLAPSMGTTSHPLSTSTDDCIHFFLSDVVLHEDMSVKEVKEELSHLLGAPPVNQMRIREKLRNRLTRVYVKGKTLKENCQGGIRDFKEIVIQRVDEGEEITEQHVLVSVHQVSEAGCCCDGGVRPFKSIIGLLSPSHICCYVCVAWSSMTSGSLSSIVSPSPKRWHC